MTIEPGQTWGEPKTDPEAATEVENDTELAAWARARLGQRSVSVTPLSGDVLRTLGLEAPRRHPDRYRYPVDLASTVLELDGDEVVETAFVAHLTVRDRRFSGLGPGLSLALMNAPWLGPLRLGPKAHLNDGILDLLEGVVGWRQQREATRRSRTGTHLPHPNLSSKRVRSWSREFSRPTTVWLDDVPVGGVRTVTVEIVPDAMEVVA